MKRMKSRGKGDSNSALGDPGRLPRVHQRRVSKREVTCAGRARWRGSPGSVGKGAEEVPGMRPALEAMGSLMWVGFFLWEMRGREEAGEECRVRRELGLT